MGFDYDIWYERNKEKRNAARRKKYAEDEDYREQVLSNTREIRRKQREERREERKAERKATRVNVTGRWKEFKIKTKQGEVTAVTIGALARSVGCSIKTLRDWERKKLIPKTRHRSKRGDRLYTPEQVLHIKELAEERGLLESTRPTRRFHTQKTVQYRTGKPVQTVMFRVGTFAKIVGRNISSILQMEKRGALPETPFRSGGQRLYTHAMIVSARLVFMKWEGVEEINWDKFESEIRKEWTRQKVFDAEIMSGGSDG